MGKTMSLSFKNKFMDTLEQYMLSSYHVARLDYYIYIDGIFVWTYGENSLRDLKNNSFHRTIKFKI